MVFLKLSRSPIPLGFRIWNAATNAVSTGTFRMIRRLSAEAQRPRDKYSVIGFVGFVGSIGFVGFVGFVLESDIGIGTWPGMCVNFSKVDLHNYLYTNGYVILQPRSKYPFAGQ